MLKKIVASIGCLAYLAIGVVQVFATIAWFSEWWEWEGVFAILGAIVVSYIPILGTVTGIMGAIRVWQWTPADAVLFFCWPFILYIVTGVLCKIGNIFTRRRRAK